MAANSQSYEIDDSEEDALLKSDEECEITHLNPTQINTQYKTTPMDDEDSLLAEARQLAREYLENNKSFSDLEGEDNDDSDEDFENEILLEYKKVMSELQSNKFVYDKYIRLCELSIESSDLDIIRKSYKMFSEVYPLSSDLWRKYINIELNVAHSQTEIENVEALYRKALSDYYSVDLALEFAQFATRTSKPEKIWHEVISTYGLHTMRGQEVFKRYRRYITSLERKSESDKQNAFIESYLLELQYPLHNMPESYIEFKILYEKNKEELVSKINWEKINEKYFKAKEHLLKIMPFEQQLNSISAKSFQRAVIYNNYIKESDKFLNENSLQVIYERMVADCCLNPDCWLIYINFIDYRDEFDRPRELQELPVFLQTALDISSRALSNCSWSEKLFINRMHLLEKRSRPREEVQEVLENAMSVGFQTPDPAVSIWLEYLTYLRRNIDWQSEADCDVLRKNFDLAWTSLGQQWGVLADCDCEILQFWGKLEYGPLGDNKRGSELWSTVMESSDNALKAALWIEYTELESRRNIISTRELYRKALNTEGIDNPYVIASAWQRFERCNGSMKSVSQCDKECSEALYINNLKYEHTKHSEKQTKPKITTNAPESKRKAEKSNKTQSESMVNKAKILKTEEVEQSPSTSKSMLERKQHETVFKEHEDQEIDLTKDHLRIFLSNLDYNLTSEDIINGFSDLKIVNVDLIRSANGRSRGFGYLELENEMEVEKALSMDRFILNGRPVFISSVLRDKERRQKFKYSGGLEPNKVFIKSLPNDTTKEEIEKIFGEYGKLKDVRLVYHKSGKFKNIAYVEYETEQAAKIAVFTADEMELRGHTISVDISAPPPKSSTSANNSNKMFVPSGKRNKAFEQKPRMTLIPNAVRKNLTATNNTVPEAPTNGATVSKTNEEFRQLLKK